VADSGLFYCGCYFANNGPYCGKVFSIIIDAFLPKLERDQKRRLEFVNEYYKWSGQLWKLFNVVMWNVQYYHISPLLFANNASLFKYSRESWWTGTCVLLTYLLLLIIIPKLVLHLIKGSYWLIISYFNFFKFFWNSWNLLNFRY